MLTMPPAPPGMRPPPPTTTPVAWAAPAAAPLAPGVRVMARRAGKAAWYAGVVTMVHANGSLAIAYDDGRREMTVPPHFVRPAAAPPPPPPQPPPPLQQPPPPPPLQHDADITISEHDVAESLRPLPPAETDAVAEQREGCKLYEPLPPAPPIDRSNSVAGLGPRRRSLHPSGAGGPLLPTTANANEGIDAEAPSPSPKKQLSPARRRRSSCATAAAFESPSRVVDAAQPAPLAKGSSFVFSPDEGTPPEVDVRPAQPLSKGILTPNRALSRTPSGRVSWAPGTPTPLPSRERLHKRARGISDAALEEAGY